MNICQSPASFFIFAVLFSFFLKKRVKCKVLIFTDITERGWDKNARPYVCNSLIIKILHFCKKMGI